MGGKPVTKPGQSQTVNIARTISAVSSAALFLPGILVRPAGQTIRGAALADCCPSVLLVRSDHRSTSFSKAPPIHFSNPKLSNKSCRPDGVRSAITKIPNYPSKPRIGMRKGKIPLEKATLQEITIRAKCSAFPTHTLCHIADSFATSTSGGRWLLAASKKQRRSDPPAT
jgi:hypothetical protein